MVGAVVVGGIVVTAGMAITGVVIVIGAVAVIGMIGAEAIATSEYDAAKEGCLSGCPLFLWRREPHFPLRVLSSQF